MNNTNYMHVLSEAAVVGGISLYFYNKISELESTIEDLKNQIMAQNNQIRYLISQNGMYKPYPYERLNYNESNGAGSSRVDSSRVDSNGVGSSRTNNGVECENGVCYLKPKQKMEGEKPPENKKVSISKISKQIEYDRENMFNNQTSKIDTFTNFSPNPVLQSVTPKPSESADEEDIVQKILNDIDDE